MLPKKVTDKKNSEQEGGFKGKVIDKNAALAALAMDGASGWQRFTVFACYVIGTLALVIVFMPPYEANKQLCAGGGSASLIFIAMMFVISRYRKLTNMGHPELEESASLPPPADIKLSPAEREKVQDVLKNARQEAFDFLHALNSSLLDQHVRGNIFFPEYGPSGKWDDYCLKIRSGLHINMNSEAEIAIVLRPKQGATGLVFHSGDPRVARKLDPNSTSGWEETHRITPDLEKILDKDLQWVISMPLKGDGGRCIGVLNVDGLVHEFTNDQLLDCMKKLTPYPFIIDGFIRR